MRPGRLGWSVFAIAVVVTLLLVGWNALLYVPATSLKARSPARQQDVHAQLRFLEGAIAQGAAHDMQRIYPEGYFFQHVLTGLAWCDLARTGDDPALRREASHAARRALAAIESKEGTRIFPTQALPRNGVFYAAWTSLLRGKILELDGLATDSVLRTRWREGLDEIASAYQGTSNPYQPSYEGMAWSGDNAMAILALASHDRLVDTTRFRPTIQKWVARVRTTLDFRTGMPPFELDHPSGAVIRSARGSSQTLFAWAMTEIDTSFAREQYQRLRDHFYTTRLGLPLVREYPLDSVGMADYDSGPVVWGVGASATIVTLATARKFGDTAFAQALESTIRLFGIPVRWRGGTRFALGQMPVADAWIAWARTSTPASGLQVTAWPMAPRWRGTLHGLSLFLALGMWGGIVQTWRRPRSRPVDSKPQKEPDDDPAIG